MSPNLLALALCLLGAMILGYLVVGHHYDADLLSTDQLYTALVLKLFFKKGLSYYTWFTTTTVYIFPSMIFVGAGLLLANWNIYYGMLIAMFLQLIFFYAAVLFFCSRLVSRRQAITIASFSTLFVMVLFVSDPKPFYCLMAVVAHMGLLAFILIFLSIYMSSMLEPHATFIKSFLLMLLFSLFIASDTVFYIWFVFPLLVSLGVLLLKRMVKFQHVLFWFISIVSAVIVGQCVLRPLLMPHEIVQTAFFSLRWVPENFTKIVTEVSALTVFSKMWLVAVAIIFAYFVCYFLKKTFFRGDASDDSKDAVAAYFMATFYLSVTLIGVAVVLMVSSKPAFRYVKPAYVLPLFFFTGVFGADEKKCFVVAGR